MIILIPETPQEIAALIAVILLLLAGIGVFMYLGY
jgi:hypothetical protein